MKTPILINHHQQQGLIQDAYDSGHILFIESWERHRHCISVTFRCKGGVPEENLVHVSTTMDLTNVNPEFTIEDITRSKTLDIASTLEDWIIMKINEQEYVRRG